MLDALAARRLLPEVDAEAERRLAAALEAMPKSLRRRVLLAYLGFPFYDAATLPLLQNEGLTEFDAVKVDRISPEDATLDPPRRHPRDAARDRVLQFRRLLQPRLPRERLLVGPAARRRADDRPGLLDARRLRRRRMRGVQAARVPGDPRRGGGRLTADKGLVAGIRRGTRPRASAGGRGRGFRLEAGPDRARERLAVHERARACPSP